jgi:hypothetical protein
MSSTPGAGAGRLLLPAQNCLCALGPDGVSLLRRIPGHRCLAALVRRADALIVALETNRHGALPASAGPQIR